MEEPLQPGSEASSQNCPPTPANSQHRIIMTVVRQWVQLNMGFPYPPGSAFFGLLRQVREETGNEQLTARTVRRYLEEVRAVYWPDMVTEAGGVPLIHRPTQTRCAISRQAAIRYGFLSRPGFLERALEKLQKAKEQVVCGVHTLQQTLQDAATTYEVARHYLMDQWRAGPR